MILVGDIVPLRSSFESPDFGEEIVIGNLEGPICRGDLRSIYKVGPCLCSNPFTLKGKWIFSLANNHIMDYSDEGLKETLSYLSRNDSWCCGCCGAGWDKAAARKAFIINDGGLKIAIISCCERQFGVATSSAPGVAAYGDWVEESIVKNSKNVDRVIVSCHAGSELSTAVSPRLRAMYHHWIDVGADVIHGHHAHIPQGVECYRGKPIFYGLGNYIIDRQKWQNTSDALWSLVVRLDLSSHLPRWSLEPSGEYPASWEKYVMSASKIFDDENEVKRTWENNCRALYPRYYRPYLGLTFRSCVRWLLHPIQQWLLLKCFRECETHKDIIITAKHLTAGETL